jgi:hypothetical protein
MRTLSRCRRPTHLIFPVNATMMRFFLLTLLIPLSATAANWVDGPVPTQISRQNCEQGRQTANRTFPTAEQHAVGAEPTNNLMSCYGLHHDRNDIFDACMSHGVDVNQRCSLTQSGFPDSYPLDFAVAHLNEHAVNELLVRGADAQRGHPVQQLQPGCAKSEALERCVRILQALVRYGANVNDRQRSDWVKKDTTLFMALAGPGISKDWLSALLSNGANINAEDSQGCTALDLAERREHLELADFLKERGAGHGFMCRINRGIETLPWILCIFGGCSTH